MISNISERDDVIANISERDDVIVDISERVMTEPVPPVLMVEPPPFSDSDDEAWERLFAELTGGTEEVSIYTE